MKLLDDIIVQLSDRTGSLTDALLKTKVVMHKLGHKELTTWVNNELNGYPGDAELPGYRVVASSVRGVINSLAMRMHDHPLPIKHLPEMWQGHYTRNKIRSSVAQLEKFAASDSPLTSQIGPEWYPRFSQPLEEGLVVIQAWIRIEPTQITRILIEIRSRLLDFLLNVQSELGDAEGDAEVKEAGKTMDAGEMFRGAVFGDNATVVLGNHNTTTINNSVKKGDFESLARVLRQNNVQESDVQSLQQAITIDADDIEFQSKKPGAAVTGWQKEMLGKAVDGAWNIQLGVAGNLLTDALKSYYGG